MSTSLQDEKSPQRTQRTGKNRFTRAFSYFLLTIFLLGMAGAGTVCGIIIRTLEDQPVWNRNSLLSVLSSRPQTGFVYFSPSGNEKEAPVAGPISNGIHRLLITDPAEMPAQLMNALVAKEDHKYYQHSGVNPVAILRAASEHLQHKIGLEVKTSGGSTLSQQLAKLVLQSKYRRLSDKIRELPVALELEKNFSKSEILVFYLNNAPMGSNMQGQEIIGAKAAALDLFDKPMGELHLAQMAYLVGLLPSPSLYNPMSCRGGAEGSKETCLRNGNLSKNRVLDKMLLHRYISKQQYDEAMQFDIGASIVWDKPPEPANQPAASPVLVDAAVAETATILQNQGLCDSKKVCREKAKSSGLHIYTSITPDAQKVADRVTKGIRLETSNVGGEPSYEGLGAVVVENKTGRILAFSNKHAGSNREFNYALDAERTIGSTAKMIAAYGPAFQKGILTEQSMLNDLPLRKAGKIPPGVKPDYGNAAGGFMGPMTVTDAIRLSRNPPAIQAIRGLGISTAKDYLERLGIPLKGNEGESLALGALSVGTSPKKVAGAYTALVNQDGVFRAPHLVTRIVDQNGALLFDAAKKLEQPASEPVFSATARGASVRAMREVVASGTAKTIGSQFPHQYIFGKTGTSEGDQDSWMVACTKDYTIVTWTGYGDKRAGAIKDKKKTQQWFIDFYREFKRSHPLTEDVIPAFAETPESRLGMGSLLPPPSRGVSQFEEDPFADPTAPPARSPLRPAGSRSPFGGPSSSPSPLGEPPLRPRSPLPRTPRHSEDHLDSDLGDYGMGR